MNEIRCYRTEGRYNMLRPHEVSARLCIDGLPAEAPAQRLSITVEIGGENDVDANDGVWEMLDAIEREGESLLYSSARERDRTVIRWMRENQLRLDVEITRSHALRMQERAAKAALRAHGARVLHNEAVAALSAATGGKSHD